MHRARVSLARRVLSVALCGTSSLKRVTTRIVTSGEGDGQQDSVILGVETRDPVPAIQELNAMEGVYPKEKGGTGNTLILIYNGDRGVKGRPAPIELKQAEGESKKVTR